MKKFEEIGVITNSEKLVYNIFACSAQKIAIVSESVAEDPNVSIPRRSQELELSYIMAYFAFRSTPEAS